jgi:hypothetical protein
LHHFGQKIRGGLRPIGPGRIGRQPAPFGNDRPSE